MTKKEGWWVHLLQWADDTIDDTGGTTQRHGVCYYVKVVLAYAIGMILIFTIAIPCEFWYPFVKLYYSLKKKFQ